MFLLGNGIAEPLRSPFGDASALCCLAGPQSKVSRCQPNEYNCLGTELCIHMSKLCNGLHDCFDGSDEGPHCRGRCLRGMAVKEGLLLLVGVTRSLFVPSFWLYSVSPTMV